MLGLRYIEGVASLRYDPGRCVGCGACAEVCPHQVLALPPDARKAVLADPGACMECGACARNCPAGALTITPGVGCAEYIISGWIHGRDKASCGPDCC